MRAATLGGGDSLEFWSGGVRDFVASQRLKVSREQLDILVPAFDAAWAIAQRRLAPDQDQNAARDRVAHAVVDLVLAGGMTNAQSIAEAAVRRVLSS